MPQPSPIADYVDKLARELAFDPALSRRVRQEVEDHLRGAALAEAADSRTEAENRAIMKFGTPQQIAGEFRAVSLHMRMKRTGFLVLCAILAVFGAMESRVTWYGITRWDIGARLTNITEIILPIDRYAFALAIAFGLVGSIYIVSRPVPAAYGPDSQGHIRRGQFLMAAAAAAAAVAVTCEALLTAWRLAEAHWTSSSFLPVGSIMIEIGVLLAAAVYIRNTARRISAILPRETGSSASSGS